VGGARFGQLRFHLLQAGNQLLQTPQRKLLNFHLALVLALDLPGFRQDLRAPVRDPVGLLGQSHLIDLQIVALLLDGLRFLAQPLQRLACVLQFGMGFQHGIGLRLMSCPWVQNTNGSSMR